MKKVLIVDDSATMRKIIMRTLRQAGFNCDEFIEASNGAEGLERLLASFDVELVLSDVNMPVMNGLDFVRAVRSRPEIVQVPILMVTTEGGEVMVKSAIEAGASGYVTKPFTADALRAALVALAK